MRFVAALLFSTFFTLQILFAAALPKGFVDVKEVIPSIQLEIRYFSEDNFLGTRVDGYKAAKCYMSEAAAQALKKVQSRLKPFGLGLKLYDAYRPQRAVDHFVRWAKALDDTKMKQMYYPEVEKRNLFTDGYIAAKSGHSRGSSVDLTIISLREGTALDMGTHWDFFGRRSWPKSSDVTAAQSANRLLLRMVMLEHGFLPLKEEWWHFTLEHEPFPDTYFDFVIQ